jgi:hypothetical protein
MGERGSAGIVSHVTSLTASMLPGSPHCNRKWVGAIVGRFDGLIRLLLKSVTVENARAKHAIKRLHP